MTDFSTLSYTSISEIFILWYARGLKKVPLLGGTSLSKPVYWGCPPGSTGSYYHEKSIFCCLLPPVACFIVGGWGGGGGINNSLMFAKQRKQSHAKCCADTIWFSSQSRSPFSASFKTFCLTVRVYLNTQKYENPWITMTETRFHEPTRLSTQSKPLFSLKPLYANLVEVIVT